MTRDEIIATAKEAGSGDMGLNVDGSDHLIGLFERFAALATAAERAARIAAQTEAAVLAEREACAVLLARMTERRRWTRAGINGEAMMPCEYAEAIRARGAA